MERVGAKERDLRRRSEKRENKGEQERGIRIGLREIEGEKRGFGKGVCEREKERKKERVGWCERKSEAKQEG